MPVRVSVISLLNSSCKTSPEATSSIQQVPDSQHTMGLQLRRRLELRSEGDQYGTDGSRISNKDLDPVPLDSPQRRWGWPSLLGFWIAEAFSISMYQGE
jgi:hypothetical protein